MFKRQWLVPALLLILIPKGLIPDAIYTSVKGASSISRSAIISEVNQVRRAKDLSSLTENTLLDQSAQAKAKYLCATNQWAHGDWKSTIIATGYKFENIGENLEYGSETAQGVVNSWVKSPEHYANMIAPQFKQTGVGIVDCPHYQGEANQTIVVNHFGEPAVVAKTTQGKCH